MKEQMEEQMKEQMKEQLALVSDHIHVHRIYTMSVLAIPYSSNSMHNINLQCNFFCL